MDRNTLGIDSEGTKVLHSDFSLRFEMTLVFRLLDNPIQMVLVNFCFYLFGICAFVLEFVSNSVLSA